jgi:HEAT repeat protein
LSTLSNEQSQPRRAGDPVEQILVGPARAGGAGEPPAEALAPVAALMRSLSKAIKAIRLYPPENDVCRRFVVELSALLAETLRQSETVRLAIGKSKVFYRGEPVFEQDGRDEPFPGRLFWDGVREITFHAGVTEEELLQFLLLFRHADRREGRDDDIVTLLWERDLKHISYIAIDQLLDFEDSNDPVPAEFGTDFMNYVDLEANDLPEGDWSETEAERLTQEFRIRIDGEDPSLFGIKPEERTGLAAELAEEQTPEKILEGFLRILRETLFLETNEEAFVAMSGILAGTLAGRMMEGRLQEATGILHMFEELRRERTDLTPGMADALDKARGTACDEARLDVLVALLDRADITTLAALDPFLDALPPTTIEPLCEVLGRVREARSRKRLIEGLVRIGRDETARFLPFLKDPRWYLVRNIVMILGAIENPAAVAAMREVFHHEDFRVRREVLAALGRIRTSVARTILLEALADRDSRVRIAAARSLASYGEPSVPALKRIVETREFEKREPAEIAAFYEALAYSGRESVVAYLAEIARRRPLLGGSRAEAMRVAACTALGHTGSEEANKELRERAEDKSPEVRKAAQSALLRIASGRGRERPEGRAA